MERIIFLLQSAQAKIQHSACYKSGSAKNANVTPMKHEGVLWFHFNIDILILISTSYIEDRTSTKKTFFSCIKRSLIGICNETNINSLAKCIDHCDTVMCQLCGDDRISIRYLYNNGVVRCVFEFIKRNRLVDARREEVSVGYDHNKKATATTHQLNATYQLFNG